jgi:hypothetical protein
MNLGGAVAREEAERREGELEIDWLPAVSRADLAARLDATAAEQGARTLLAFLAELLPRRLAEALCAAHGWPVSARLAQLQRPVRAAIVRGLAATRLPVAGTRGFDAAEVTRGGVPLPEVDPATLESRLVPGLHLCGELLDLDGPIGGFNFSAAFATGALAGSAIARAVLHERAAPGRRA